MRTLTTATIAIAVLTLASTGCRKKPPEMATQAVLAPATTAATAATPEAVPDAVIQQMIEQFNKVHFELDQAELSAGSMEALAANAAILQKYPRLTIEVQGHADERGTTDYNLALGNKRADAVTRYLGQMGVASSRVRKLSLGEEQPVDDASNEVAWSKNRRCEFRILTPQQGVVGTTE